MTDTTETTPRRRWWLIALTAALALMQTGAVVRTLQRPPELAALVSLNPPLELIAGGGWALLFGGITVNLLRSRAAQPAILALCGFFIYSVVRLMLFAQADYDQNRLPFLILLSLCLLVFPVAFLLRR